VFDEPASIISSSTEAHYFQEPGNADQDDRVSGIQTGGSERAFDVYMKSPLPRCTNGRAWGDVLPRHARFPIRCRDGTRCSASSTRGLRSRGLEHSTPGRPRSAKSSTDGNLTGRRGTSAAEPLRHDSPNLPELQQMFRAFSDVQTAEMLTAPGRVWNGQAIIVPADVGEQYALSRTGSSVTNACVHKKSDPRLITPLSITTDGTQARHGRTDALSHRPRDFPESKVNS